MIESITFQNFKALRNTTLPLGPCTVLVGPNGSGKSTVLEALQAISTSRPLEFDQVVSVELRQDPNTRVEVQLRWSAPHSDVKCIASCGPGSQLKVHISASGREREPNRLKTLRENIQVYSFDADAIAAPVQLQTNMELAPNGAGLAGVLTRLQDRQPERFESLNKELVRWLPEFDRVLFDVDANNRRVFFLRTQEHHHAIPAAEVSQGTLLALALLTLTHLPEPPSLIALEEPDRGIHPRLLRRVQDALYRLSHPEGSGEKLAAVQVIATTHSPYFLDLFKDHPEEIVIANKVGLDVQFERLSDQPDIDEILGDAPLGEAWYTGILGGVPSTP